MDASLIKVDENPVALQQVLPPSIPEKFILKPRVVGLMTVTTTIPITATTNEGPKQCEAIKIMMGPTIITPAPEPYTL